MKTAEIIDEKLPHHSAGYFEKLLVVLSYKNRAKQPGQQQQQQLSNTTNRLLHIFALIVSIAHVGSFATICLEHYVLASRKNGYVRCHSGGNHHHHLVEARLNNTYNLADLHVRLGENILTACILLLFTVMGMRAIGNTNNNAAAAIRQRFCVRFEYAFAVSWVWAWVVAACSWPVFPTALATRGELGQCSESLTIMIATAAQLLCSIAVFGCAELAAAATSGDNMRMMRKRTSSN